MSRNALLDLLRRTSNIHIHLLERPNLVVLAIRQVLHRTHHACSRRKQEQSRVLATMRHRYKADLEVQGDVILAFGFPKTKRSGHLLKSSLRRPPYYSAIQLDTEVLATIDLGTEGLCHSECDEKGGNVGDSERLCDDAACSGKMVEETARGAIGCVYRAEETYTRIQS